MSRSARLPFSLLFSFVLCLPVCVSASGPAGLVGRAETVPAGAIFIGGTGQHFEWYEPFGVHRFDSGEKVTVSFAIVPFAGYGATRIGLDSENGATFVGINFDQGLVNGKLSFDAATWNVVEAFLDFGSQTYRLTINGGDAGTYGFASAATSLRAFRVNYRSHSAERSIAWFDSIVISRGASVLLAVDFENRLPAQKDGEVSPVIATTFGDVPKTSANANRPQTRVSGLAGRGESNFWAPEQQYFQWYDYFGPHSLPNGGQVELSFFIMPFHSETGDTFVGLDSGQGSTFFGLAFQNGQLNGNIAYNARDWNLVKATLDFASQSYRLAVNGSESGPHPFTGSATSVAAFRVNFSSRDSKPITAWFDSVNVHAGGKVLLSVDFDQSVPGKDDLGGESRLTAEDPVAAETAPMPDKLSVITPPEHKTAALGQTVTLRVEAVCPGLITYQWQLNGMPMSGATSATLALPNITAAMQGCYQVVVTDGNGVSIKTEPAMLSILQGGGTVIFSNRILPEIDAPIFAEDGTTRLAGERYWAQLYGGASADALLPVGPAVPFRTAAAAGYWSALQPATRTIPTVAPGEVAVLQVRAWETGLGASFEQTVARGGATGMSATFSVITGGGGTPPTIPSNLNGLHSFRLARAAMPAPPQTASPIDASDNSGAVRPMLTVTGERIRLSFLAKAGAIYEMQHSSDLVDWRTGQSGFSIDGILSFEEARSGTSMQFYRVRQVPPLRR
jgi:hypothetical protein